MATCDNLTDTVKLTNFEYLWLGGRMLEHYSYTSCIIANFVFK